MSKICAIIPSYNAEKTIETLIQRVGRFIQPRDIIVVDDGSSDRTFEIALNLGAVALKLERNSGKGKALKTGFEFAKKAGYDAVLTLDADFQHNPDEIPKFIKKFDEGFDIVIGNRMKNLKPMPIERIFSNKITSFLISIRTGKKILDSQCGFRLISMRVIQNVDARADGFAFESEFLIKALLAGFKVGFVDIETIYNDGKSNIKHLRDTLNFISIYFQSFFWKNKTVNE